MAMLRPLWTPSSGIRAGLILSLALAGSAPALARDLIAADGPGDTYALVQRSYGTEVPDCGHMQPHITEEMDSVLGKPVFVFHAHVNQDDDRCGKTDRQRTELRGRSAGVQGTLGSTLYYRWKMKLPTGFQVSPNFTHLMQIKAYGNGHGSGAPIMTLAARSPGNFGIDGRIGNHGNVPLTRLINEWVVLELKVVHSNSGSVAIEVKRLRDGQLVMSYSGNHDMVDDGSAYGAPKFGIYRSLNNRGSLRDEQVRFADFCVSKVSFAECADSALPPPPADAGLPPADAGAEPDPGPPADAAAEPDSAAQPDSGPALDTASPPPGTGGAGGSPSPPGPSDAGSRRDVGSAPPPGSGPSSEPTSGGCSCEVGGGRGGRAATGTGGGLALGLLGLWGLGRARRRGHAPRR